VKGAYRVSANDRYALIDSMTAYIANDLELGIPYARWPTRRPIPRWPTNPASNRPEPRSRRSAPPG